MSVAKILIFPGVSLLASLLLWLLKLFTGKTIVIIYTMLILLYLLIQLYRYGILLTSPKIHETICPHFTFYYKEYDCEYKEVRPKIYKELNEADGNMLKSQPQVNYVEIYQNHNPALTQGHTLAGFALRSVAEYDIGIAQVMKALNFKKRVFNECPSIVSSLKKVDELSSRIALDKLAGQLWDYAKNIKKTNGVLFKWEEKKTVSCGVWLGAEAKQFNVKGFLEEPNVKSEFLQDDSLTKHKKDI